MRGRRIWSRPDQLLRFAALGVVTFHVLAFGLWSPGSDAHIYYVVDLADPYPGDVFQETYNYSPAFAWWVQPLQALPFAAFHTLVVGLNMAGLVFMVGPVLTAVLLLAQLQPVWLEFQLGNLNFATGALLVLGFAAPGLYAPVLLSKVTPGIGLVWFLVRREWRAVAIAAGVTLILALPSLVLHLDAWTAFADSLRRNAQLDAQIGAPLVLRAALGLAVVTWGAVTGRRWTVLLAAALVAHVNSAGWLVLVGVVRLWRDRASEPAPAAT